MDLEEMNDCELDEHRREVLAEQERRKKVEEGADLIGQVVRDYMEAARLDCPDLDDSELGHVVVGLIEGADPDEWGGS